MCGHHGFKMKKKDENCMHMMKCSTMTVGCLNACYIYNSLMSVCPVLFLSHDLLRRTSYTNTCYLYTAWVCNLPYFSFILRHACSSALFCILTVFIKFSQNIKGNCKFHMIWIIHLYHKASKNKCLVSHQKKNQKHGGRCFFFKTAKMTLDHAHNEWTKTVQEYSWDILFSSKL